LKKILNHSVQIIDQQAY